MYMPVGNMHINFDDISYWYETEVDLGEPMYSRIKVYLKDMSEPFIWKDKQADMFKIMFYFYAWSKGKPQSLFYDPWEMVRGEITDALASHPEKLEALEERKPIKEMTMGELYKAVQWARTATKPKTGPQEGVVDPVDPEPTNEATTSPEPPVSQQEAPEAPASDVNDYAILIGVARDMLASLPGKPIKMADINGLREMLFKMQEAKLAKDEVPANVTRGSDLVRVIQGRVDTWLNQHVPVGAGS